MKSESRLPVCNYVLLNVSSFLARQEALLYTIRGFPDLGVLMLLYQEASSGFRTHSLILKNAREKINTELTELFFLGLSLCTLLPCDK